ncbi:MAG: tRNA (guanine-N1)-methyltransferase [Gilvibacter sp.]
MFKTIRILCCFSLMAITPMFGQNTPTTLEDQFVDVIDKSNRYQDYKVVKRYKLDKLKKSVNDTIGSLKSTISGLEGTVSSLQNELSDSQSNLAKTNDNLSASKTAENNMSLFGMQTTKGSYNTIMWSVIGILLAFLLFFIYRFKNSNSITKEANTKLAEVEEEFESHRGRALEREQQIRRKLQDEINKNKKAT